MPDVAIVILSMDRSFSLQQTISAIKQNTSMPARIYVVDQGSGPEHLPHIEQMAPGNFELIRRGRPYTCGEGRRFALSALKEEKYVAFIDDDIQPADRWLANMMAVFAEHDDAGVVTGNLVNDGDGGFSGCRFVRDGEAMLHEFGYLGDCDFTLGGATLYLREAIEKTVHRPEYGAAMEDWDQTLQIKELGYTLHGSRAVFYHNHLKENAEYRKARYREREIVDAGIAFYERHRIKTGLRNSLRGVLGRDAKLRPDQWQAIARIGI